MKTTFAISALSIASLASARSINKARTSEVAAPKQAFELDVTTTLNGLQDYYSRDDGFIYVNIAQDDNVESATVRSVNNDVTCTISDIRGYAIRSFGGQFPDTYERQPWENDHADSIGCFFPGESQADYADKITRRQEPSPPSSAPHQAFEMDLTYATAGVQDFYSREDGFIEAAVIPGDKLVGAVVRSIAGDVVCTITDADGYQVRKFGGEHPQSIELSEYEGVKAANVGCYFPGEGPAAY